jgi:hypothetical protein
MKYRIVLPRMLRCSSATCAPFFGVIFALRRFVFICGDTLAIVPLMMVPVLSSIVTVSLWHFIKNLVMVQPIQGFGQPALLLLRELLVLGL